MKRLICLPLGAALVATVPDLANADAASDAAATPSPTACLKTVNAIGASMGGAESKETSSGTNLHFVVRANGVDYDVVCDPATGVVSDVSRRTAPLPN